MELACTTTLRRGDDERVKLAVGELLDAAATKLRAPALADARIDAPIRQMVGPSTVSSESGLQTFEPEQVFAALHERRRGGPPEEALVTCFRELLREAENRESTPA